ncbi:MAG: hypothetical protein K2N51_05515 [Lachnospiraceae bacterium]|nr:hypothetical protein [Lachnospiraceae bacterium]
MKKNTQIKLRREQKIKRLFKGIIAIFVIAVMACETFCGIQSAKADTIVSNKIICKNYYRYLKQYAEEYNYKYFALVDANKDGKPELVTAEKKVKKSAQNAIGFASFNTKTGETHASGAIGSKGFVYYNTKQKGILTTLGSNYYYEYMRRKFDTVDGGKGFGSWGRSLCKNGKKYSYYKGDAAGDHVAVEWKTISKATYKKYKKSWAFSPSNKTTKKVKFYKINKKNLKKLKNGKIKIQK